MMLHPETFAYYSDEARHVSAHVAGHELTHSLHAGLTRNVFDSETGDVKLDDAGNPLTTKVALGDQYQSTLEEIRAETGSLFFGGIFLEKGKLSEDDYRKEIVKEFMWCLKHYSYGMLEPDGKPKTYSQVGAAIVHHLMKEGVITFIDGKFKIDFDNYQASITTLFQNVSHYQLTGDREQVAALLEPILEGGDGYNMIQATYVTESFSSLSNFSYSFDVTGIE